MYSAYDSPVMISHKKRMMFLYYYHCLIDNKRLRTHELFHLPFIYDSSDKKITAIKVYSVTEFTTAVKKFKSTGSRGQCYKTFSVRDLHIFVLS